MSSLYDLCQKNIADSIFESPPLIQESIIGETKKIIYERVKNEVKEEVYQYRMNEEKKKIMKEVNDSYSLLLPQIVIDITRATLRGGERVNYRDTWGACIDSDLLNSLIETAETISNICVVQTVEMGEFDSSGWEIDE